MLDTQAKRTEVRAHLLLVVIVVRRGEQVTEDELGNPDALLLVNLDRDTATIIEDGDGAGFFVDSDLELIHRGVVDLCARLSLEAIELG